MTAISVSAPFPILTDIDGDPLDAGYVYIGQANLDPAAFPKAAYWDASLTTPAAQPIRTAGGYPVRNGSPARIYTDGDYSIRINNKNGTLVYSSPAATDRVGGGLVTGVDSSVVAYTPAGTGAVATTVQSKLRESVSFADFGCVGDGSDEATKLQTALTYASANGKAIIDYSGKTYNYGTTLNVGAIEMYGNFTLNGTGAAFVNITGTLTEVGYISASATAGANTITLSSVAGLAADDLLILWNSVASSYSPHRSNYYDGEFARVDGVSGSVVTLQSNLLTSYSGVSTDKVFKSSGIRVVIDGPSFTGAGVFALRVQYADNVLIRPENIRTSGTQAAVIINKCYNVLIEGGQYYAPYDGVGGNYGISVSNSQFVTVRNVDSFGGRHAVTTGGDSDNGAVPCRYVNIENSILTNDPDSAVYCADFHGNTLDSYYKDCTIYGRVGLAGERIGIVGGTVYSWPSSTTAPLGYHELVGGQCLFQNVRALVGIGSTATEIVSNLGSSLTAKISKPYQIVVDGLDATLNASVTKIVNAYENSGQPNAWVLNDFGIRGTISGLVDLVRFTLASPGVDASYINVTNPGFDVSSYTLVGKSNTTLPNCRFLFPSFVGSNANGSWTKFPDGTLICSHDFSIATTAIDSAFLGGYRTGALTWTFPKTFTEAPRISITPDDATCFSGVISTSGTGTSMTFFLTAVTSQTAATRSARLVAVGRWY